MTDWLVKLPTQVLEEADKVLSVGSGIPRGLWSYHLGRSDLAQQILDEFPEETSESSDWAKWGSWGNENETN